MHIILLILKIIGIFLAVLFGLLFFIFMTALFVPLRYRLEGWRRQDGGEMAVKGRVSWFLSLIVLRFGYEKEAFFQIRLLGIPWNGGRRKKPEGSAPKEAAYVKTETEKGPPGPAVLDQAPEEMPDPPVILKTTAVETKEKPAGPEEAGAPEDVRAPEKNGATEKTAKIFGKIRNILHGLWEKLKGIPRGARRFRTRLAEMAESLRQKKEKLGRWRAYLRSEEVKATVRLLWRQTKRLFRHLRPQKVRIRGRFGFGDPALTGQATGLMSLLPVFYQKELSLQPEFREACLEGEFFLKGRVRAATLLLLALKIWFNKDFQKVYKHLKAM